LTRLNQIEHKPFQRSSKLQTDQFSMQEKATFGSDFVANQHPTDYTSRTAGMCFRPSERPCHPAENGLKATLPGFRQGSEMPQLLSFNNVKSQVRRLVGQH